MFPNYSTRRFVVTALAVIFVVSGILTPTLLRPSAASTPPNLISQVGLDVNYPTPQSFINSLSSQGMTWIRQYGPNGNTPLIHQAGMKELMVLNENLFSYNPANFGWQSPQYTDIHQLTPSQWASYVTTAAKTMPWITQWEFLNEPNLAGGGSEPSSWTPQQYFQYLVPTYQALKAANPNNVLIGPTLAWPWPIDSYGVTNGIVDWLQTLWSLKDPTTGLTAATMLSAVSMHIYTCCWGGAKMMSDPYTSTETEGQLIQSGLAQCYAVTGKPMVIDEWGWPSASTTSGGVTVTSSPTVQATYYQQFMALMESTPHIAGVFAFNWSDYGEAGGSLGVFDSNLQPKAAWPVYEQFYPTGSSTSSTSTTTSTTSTSTSTATSSSSSSSSSSTSSTSTQSGGAAVVTVQSDWTNGGSFSGIYVAITSNGLTVASGTTPLTLTGTLGNQYTVTFYYYPPFTYGTVYFDHLSTGSTSSSATLTLTGPTTLVAYYRTSQSSSSTTSTSTTTTTTSSTSTSSAGPTLSISSVSSGTKTIRGFYIQSVIDISSNKILMSGTYTPHSLSVPAGHSISVTLDDFGSLHVIGSNVGTFSRTTANGGGGTATFTVNGNTILVFTLSSTLPTTTTTPFTQPPSSSTTTHTSGITLVFLVTTALVILRKLPF